MTYGILVRLRDNRIGVQCMQDFCPWADVKKGAIERVSVALFFNFLFVFSVDYSLYGDDSRYVIPAV